MNTGSRTKAITRAKIVPLETSKRGDRRRRQPPTGGPSLPRYLTQDELARFRHAVVNSGDTRDIVLFGLMYRFGLRAVEGTRLLLEDLDLARGRIRIRRAKGGAAKEYPLPRDLLQPLRRYLRKRTDHGPYLFTGRESNNQRGLTVLRVRQLFKEYGSAAGLPASVASHSLRHSIAVHALEDGWGLEYVQDLLGHTSIRSTAIYARITSRGRDEMMRKLDRSPHIVAWS